MRLIYLPGTGERIPVRRLPERKEGIARPVARC
jgi:hypothetical protein